MQDNLNIQQSSAICMIYAEKWVIIWIQLHPHSRCSSRSVRMPLLQQRLSSLKTYKNLGIPTIRFAQKHVAANLLNLSTVATFFSAVTATTLQFSFTQTGTHISDAVNSFWFLSLVFSIASAVNSLLGVTWKQAM